MSMIVETANPVLEQALTARLQRRSPAAGSLGVLDGLGIRLGLLQHSLRPTFVQPHLLLFAADHGLAVDGLQSPHGVQTADLARQVLEGQHPLGALATAQGMTLKVVDGGLSAEMPPVDGLVSRKIAHGTRHARVGPAMSIEQAHAAIRAGMEIADRLPGHAMACAGLAIGGDVAASLVISRLADVPVVELLRANASIDPAWVAHLTRLAEATMKRHEMVGDPVEVLAAFGGYETAMMVGAILVAASKRHLVLIDGQSACAALLVASRIAQATPDYALFCRSSPHLGLDRALAVFQAGVLLDLGLDTLDGTGACMAWPLVRAAAAQFASLADDDELSQPAGIPRPAAESAFDPDDSSMDGWIARV